MPHELGAQPKLFRFFASSDAGDYNGRPLYYFFVVCSFNSAIPHHDDTLNFEAFVHDLRDGGERRE